MPSDDGIPEWWTPRVIRAIRSGLHRFEDIQSELGIARNILTDRLKTMVSSGILLKQQYSENPKRYEYFVIENEDGTSGQPAIVPA